MLEKREFYIDGQWVSPLDGRDFEVIDPSNEEPFAVISLGGQADSDHAVAAAKRAFPGWAATPPAERIASARATTHCSIGANTTASAAAKSRANSPAL